MFKQKIESKYKIKSKYWNPEESKKIVDFLKSVDFSNLSEDKAKKELEKFDLKQDDVVDFILDSFDF
jgi:hypothetical protein